MATASRSSPRPAVLVLALAGWSCAPGSPASGRLAITDGSEDSGHPTVGRLLVPTDPASPATCTGTLVGERTVLTAAHCLIYDGPYWFVLESGAIPVARVVPHPGFDPEVPVIPPEDDIGVALLARAPGLRPAPVADEMARPGSPLVLVGFGTTGELADDGGVKRSAINTVEQVLPTRFSIDGSGGGVGNLCHGDSGGPALFVDREELVLGVTSASEGKCGKSRSWDTRVDAYLGWLLAVTRGDLRLPDREPPRVLITAPSDGETLRGELDVEATVLDVSPLQAVELEVDGTASGSAGLAPFSFALTLDPGQHRLEVQATDALGQQGKAAVQVTIVSGDLPTDSPCSHDVECASGLCFDDPQLDEAYCSASCDPGGDPCPAELTCAEPAPGLAPLCLRRTSDAGGCAVAGGSPGPEEPWLLLLAALWLRRRRCRR